MTINILLPVLNENLRLEKGVVQTVTYLRKLNKIPFKITIIDNGSTDDTPEIGQKISENFKEVEYIQLRDKGVGLAFREGVLRNTSEIVGYMDCDLSTDLSHLNQVIDAFIKNDTLDMVNGSRFCKGAKTYNRKWYRNITSYGLTFLLKLFLGMKASDSICGFKFFRKNTAEKLIKESSSENGWFFIIELLIRGEKEGINILELPVKWSDDPNTKVKLFKVISEYIKNISRLFYELNFK